MTDVIEMDKSWEALKQDWHDAFDDVVAFEGRGSARQLVESVSDQSRAYVNTISVEDEAPLPDDGVMTERLTNWMRWNAIVMVMHAGKFASELGGHIASYAAIATLFEVGLQYLFRGSSEGAPGDFVFFQGHSSPGIYARAFLEGRLTSEQVLCFRQEVFKDGVSSYPHPWLMPDFWQFPTVSMGLGPLMAIYQAQFLRYLHHRGLADTSERHVWAFCGDGEMGEVDSLGALNLAGREKLDNLTFIISCNLQRLDGPVWGNGQIIQEYERVFAGAGWYVIKIIWGTGWDALFEKDADGVLLARIADLVDGEYQAYSAKDGAYFREHFFGRDPRLLALVEHLSDVELKQLKDGGHDIQKVYAGLHAARYHEGQPTVVLAKTIKGYGMGASGEAQNVTHQTKKMKPEDLKILAERFELPITGEELELYSPPADSEEIKYLQAQRKALGGYLPERLVVEKPLSVPPLSDFHALLEDSQEREFSTTMAFVRFVSILLKHKEIAPYVVPIVADESRTFGMEGLFRQIGIYAPFGQAYEPEDRKTLMYYREDASGQFFQQGLSEAGAMSCWVAAATSYANNQVPMVPFYIYYSMFGYQRVGDLAWAAGDMRARGFLIGGTAGKTTLAGEGLQHQDGHNIMMFAVVPTCVTYDPTYAYEMAVIMHRGLQQMYVEQQDVYYYITGMNENYHHPAMPDGVEEGIIKGMYCLERGDGATDRHVTLLGSGTILVKVREAAEWLREHYQVSVSVWSVTSYQLLKRDMDHVERHNRLHPEKEPLTSYVTECLGEETAPVIAASDYVRQWADQIRGDISAPYHILGTDGFGRSGTRQALRDFFEVDERMVAYTALYALHQAGSLDQSDLLSAREALKIGIDRLDPWVV